MHQVSTSSTYHPFLTNNSGQSNDHTVERLEEGVNQQRHTLPPTIPRICWQMIDLKFCQSREISRVWTRFPHCSAIQPQKQTGRRTSPLNLQAPFVELHKSVSHDRTQLLFAMCEPSQRGKPETAPMQSDHRRKMSAVSVSQSTGVKC